MMMTLSGLAIVAAAVLVVLGLVSGASGMLVAAVVLAVASLALVALNNWRSGPPGWEVEEPRVVPALGSGAAVAEDELTLDDLLADGLAGKDLTVDDLVDDDLAADPFGFDQVDHDEAAEVWDETGHDEAAEDDTEVWAESGHDEAAEDDADEVVIILEVDEEPAVAGAPVPVAAGRAARSSTSGVEPIVGLDQRWISEVLPMLETLDLDQLGLVEAAERRGRGRKRILAAIAERRAAACEVMEVAAPATRGGRSKTAPAPARPVTRRGAEPAGAGSVPTFLGQPAAPVTLVRDRKVP